MPFAPPSPPRWSPPVPPSLVKAAGLGDDGETPMSGNQGGGGEAGLPDWLLSAYQSGVDPKDLAMSLSKSQRKDLENVCAVITTFPLLTPFLSPLCFGAMALARVDDGIQYMKKHGVPEWLIRAYAEGTSPPVLIKSLGPSADSLIGAACQSFSGWPFFGDYLSQICSAWYQRSWNGKPCEPGMELITFQGQKACAPPCRNDEVRGEDGYCYCAPGSHRADINDPSSPCVLDSNILPIACPPGFQSLRQGGKYVCVPEGATAYPGDDACSPLGPEYSPVWDPQAKEWGCAEPCRDDEVRDPLTLQCYCRFGTHRAIFGDPNSKCVPDGAVPVDCPPGYYNVWDGNGYACIQEGIAFDAGPSPTKGASYHPPPQARPPWGPPSGSGGHVPAPDYTPQGSGGELGPTGATGAEGGEGQPAGSTGGAGATGSTGASDGSNGPASEGKSNTGIVVASVVGVVALLGLIGLVASNGPPPPPPRPSPEDRDQGH